MRPNGLSIRAIRQAKKLSLREMERRTDRNRGYLSRLERGLIGDVAEETVDVIAHALAVQPKAITHEEKVT